MSETLVKRTLRMSGQVLLTLGALLGTACLVMAVVGATYDVKPLIFRSGSMAPAIPAGGLALAKPVDAPALKAGDVVSVRSEGTRITHRIKTVELDGDMAVLTLKGDANEVQDAHPYRVESADRVFFDVPVAGYVLSYASGPVGVFATGVIAALLVSLIFRPGQPGGGARRAPRRRRTGTGTAVLIAVLAVAVPVMNPAATWAAFSDSGTANGSSLAAHTVQRPASVSCSTSGSNATFSWTEADPRYDYEVVLWRDVTTDVLVSTNQVTGSAVSRVFNNEDDFGLSGGLIGSNQTHHFYVTVRSWLSGTSAPNRWESSDVRQSTQRVRIQITCTIILICTVQNPTCVA